MKRNCEGRYRFREWKITRESAVEIKDKEEEERNCETDTERKEKKEGTLGKGHKMEENDEETVISKQEEEI